MPDVFAQHDLDFGRTDKVAHNIKLSDETPFKQRARPIHPQDIEAVRKHIQELLDAGVIRESESPFSSPIVVVRKKNGQVRLCIDYRRLNLQTIKDAYSLPKLEDTFSALSGSQWFSVLDLKSGYYQIEVEEADKPKTAFVCPLGFWEFNRMPQGVTNAPSTFQRLMEKCMGDMHLKDVLVFIDDLIVFSKTLEEHEARLMKVLTRLREFGLKLSPEKCVFFQTSVRYLGHVVSRNGVETDPEKIAALKTWPVPKNLRELRSFLGFAGYYRRFVKAYSNIVKPLHNLTSGYPPSHKKLKSDEKAATAVPDSYGQEDHLGGLPVIPHLTVAELASRQRADQSIKHVISQIEQGEKPPPTLRHELTELPLLLRELNRLELRNNILYWRRQVGSQTFYQFVLPAELRDTVLTSLHNHMGHMGVDRTLDLVRTRFFWPKMALDVERKVKTCGRCVRRKALPERAAPLVNINTTRPLELLCMDFLSLEPDKSGTKDILVITDHFTKFAVAIPTPNQKARTVAKCLWENFMVHYGMPEKLHSDQGRDFESRTIKELCRVAGIHKVRTTPYHPRGNPVERFNRTLLGMLGTLESPEKSRWRDFVKPLVHAYNCTRNEVTGFTPYELMFGRQPRLPVDLAFGLPVQGGQQTSHVEYVQNLKSRLEDSYKIAIENAAKIAHKNKMRYDRHVTVSDLEAGDRVLVRNVRIRGKHKISDKWESIVHVVVRRAGTLPVYTVKPENQDGPLRTLHRDLLLPCGYLPTEVNKAPDQQPARRRPATRANPTVDENQLSDDEDEIIPVYCFREPPNAQFPTIHDSLVQPDPTMSTVQDKQHTEPARNCPVESPVNAQNVDCTAEINEPPDMSNGASDSPLTLNDPNCHHNDAEDLLTKRVMLDEQVEETVMTENNSPGSKNPVEEQNLLDDDIQPSSFKCPLTC
ncbi:interleukin-1 receptor accessory protein-like 1-A [Pimephales promelas]|nr:interleukin-1 receptor accessory protein-like 1-A [Pimephales promelas]